MHDLTYLIPVNRLQKILFYTVSEHLYCIGKIIISADCYNKRLFRKLLYLSYQFDPIHPRHPDIGKHHIYLLIRKHLQSLFSVFTFQNNIHGDATPLYHHMESLSDHLFIFYDQ